VTWLRAGRPVFDSQQSWKFFSTPPHTDRFRSSSSLLFDGGGVPEVKRPEGEADFSSSCSERLIRRATDQVTNTSSWRGT
jgi:hypothetical protein